MKCRKSPIKSSGSAILTLNLSTVPPTHGFMVGCSVRPRAAGDGRLPISVAAEQSAARGKELFHDVL